MYDVLQDPTVQGTLNQAQKYKKMLSLCQKVAVQSSTVGMVQFREMYSTVETLLHKWDSGSKRVIVSCNDEDQPTQEKPVQVDEFDVILDESPVKW